MTALTFDVALALYQSQESNQFPVDFDDAWQWLEYSSKAHAKEFLVANFVKSLDFISFHGQSGKLGGRPSEEIKLTVTCLKEWGMMAGTAKGKEIRRYFIECERIAKNQAQSFAAPDDFSQFGQYAEAARLLKSSKALDVDPVEVLSLHKQMQGRVQPMRSKQPALPTEEVAPLVQPDQRLKFFKQFLSEAGIKKGNASDYIEVKALWDALSDWYKQNDIPANDRLVKNPQNLFSAIKSIFKHAGKGKHSTTRRALILGINSN